MISYFIYKKILNIQWILARNVNFKKLIFFKWMIKIFFKEADQKIIKFFEGKAKIYVWNFMFILQPKKTLPFHGIIIIILRLEFSLKYNKQGIISSLIGYTLKRLGANYLTKLKDLLFFQSKNFRFYKLLLNAKKLVKLVDPYK